MDLGGIMLEILGFVASLIVLVSLLMSSIKKLRWINLVGALLFGLYGFMINSLPTGLMNVGIALIDIFYLVQMYRQKEYLRVMEIKEDKEYLNTFMDFYKKDMEKYAKIENVNFAESAVKFFVLRNMNPAGLFVADKFDENTLEVKLDYVIPQFRDFKIGNFVFESQKENMKEQGYNRYIVFTDNTDHIKYVEKMGFSLDKINNKDCYVMNI